VKRKTGNVLCRRVLRRDTKLTIQADIFHRLQICGLAGGVMDQQVGDFTVLLENR